MEVPADPLSGKTRVALSFSDPHGSDSFSTMTGMSEDSQELLTGVAVHAFNHNTEEAKIGISL